MTGTYRAALCQRLGPPEALVLADLCVAGHDKHLSEIETEFAAELEAQILPDGGHISRNPGVPVELLLDFLPLRQCFSAIALLPTPAGRASRALG